MPNTILGKVSLTPKGEYDPAASYEALDVVQYEGSGYVVLRDVQGVTPADGADYMLVAAKGGKGDIGPEGKQGEQGLPGTGLTIEDQYDTFDDLAAAIPAPAVGSNYYVGAAPPYTVYTYTLSGWVENGQIQGAQGPEGPQGIQGETGNGIASIVRTDGTGAPGTTDTYTITMTDGSTAAFTVYNGADGAAGADGEGDMSASVYDPQGRAQDIFAYVDGQIGDIAAILDSINGEVA